MTKTAPGEIILASVAEGASLTDYPWGYLGGLVLIALFVWAYKWDKSLPKRIKDAIAILEDYFCQNYHTLVDRHSFLDRLNE